MYNNMFITASIINERGDVKRLFKVITKKPVFANKKSN